jgi:hypothetical protein
MSAPPAALHSSPVTLATIEQLQAAARAAVSALLVLVDPGRAAERAPFFLSLRPRKEDYARVFVPAAVDAARAFYEAMWAQPMEMTWNLRQTELRVAAALAEDFLSWNERAEPFPRGYREVAPLLLPGVIWLRWEMKEPGDALGLSTDGLVQLAERWVWFPRPFIALAELAKAGDR